MFPNLFEQFISSVDALRGELIWIDLFFPKPWDEANLLVVTLELERVVGSQDAVAARFIFVSAWCKRPRPRGKEGRNLSSLALLGCAVKSDGLDDWTLEVWSPIKSISKILEYQIIMIEQFSVVQWWQWEAIYHNIW